MTGRQSGQRSDSWLKRLSGRPLSIAFVVGGVAAVVWGAARIIGFEETSPARGLILLGSLGLVIGLSSLAEEGRPKRLWRRRRSKP